MLLDGVECFWQQIIEKIKEMTAIQIPMNSAVLLPRIMEEKDAEQSQAQGGNKSMLM